MNVGAAATNALTLTLITAPEKPAKQQQQQRKQQQQQHSSSSNITLMFASMAAAAASAAATNAIKSKFYAPLTDRSSFCVSKMEWKKDGKYNPRASGKDGSRARRLRLVEILLLCYG